MSRPLLCLCAAFAVSFLAACREELDFSKNWTADPQRGASLFKTNCAKACHPANIFSPEERAKSKRIHNYEDLAYSVRDYYVATVSTGHSYITQDIFDITAFLDKEYYGYGGANR